MNDNNTIFIGFRAGFYYFAVVFAFGFALGTLRVLLLMPAVGEVQAVLIELPFMLAVSWVTSRKITKACRLGATLPPRIIMGAIALLLLLSAEALLSLTLLDLSLGQHMALYGMPIVQLGLISQIAFALFPAIQRQPMAAPKKYGNRY